MTAVTLSARPVEQVLDTLPDFAGARVKSQLSDGPTNSSYLLDNTGVQFVLRLDKPDAVRLGLNRSNEKRICRAVADAGLAPEPIYFEPAAGVYLRHFVPGRSWDASDLACPDKMARLARLLRLLHALPPIGAAFDPLAAARRYAAISGRARSRSILRRSEKLMQQITADSTRSALCHNDLVCQNVLEGERLMLIDWEYAGIGDPFFDLAVVVRHHKLDKRSLRRFLEAYLERSADAREKEHLGLNCDFYTCLLELWQQIHP